MKKTKILLGGACVLTACLTSCGGTSITPEEANKIAANYNFETAYNTIKTFQLKIEVKSAGLTKTTKMDIDFENPYIYSMAPIENGTEEMLACEKDGKYYVITSAGSMETTAQAITLTAKSLLSTLKNAIFFSAIYLNTEDGITTTIKADGNKLDVTATGSLNGVEGSAHVKCNEYGLIEEMTEKMGTDETAMTVKYNQGISKKTSL